jgi:serine protease Do
MLPDIQHRQRRWFIGLLFVTAFSMATAWGCQSARGQEDDGAAKGKGLSKAFRAAAHKVIPTVVKIKNITKAKRVDGLTGKTGGVNPFQGTPFEDFFHDEGLPPGIQFHGVIPPRMGVGSGVIIDPKGIILTNNHVVEGADEVLVELADGRQLNVSDIKADEQSDLAVMRVKTNRLLPAAALGDSDTLDIGDWVIAVGCPFELDSTVSAGIISGKGRVLSADSRASFLQTDAAINPGNSGGPLVNLDGEVIGINTAIESSTGAYQGIGFAIPSNLVKWVVPQLIKNGAVKRAYLGVKIGEINGELADHLGVIPNSGVIVSEVIANSPADSAGLQAGDIILSFAEKNIVNPQQLQELVERSPNGSKQQVEILRNGKQMKLPVEVQALPDKFAAESPALPGRERNNNRRGSSSISVELGLEVSDLAPEIAAKLGSGADSGAIVTAVQPQSVAAQNGIREGMIILRVGQKTIRSAADFKAAMKDQSLEKGVPLLIRAQNGNRFLLLK